ncbi:MAG: sugar nucleotide-binding protein [Deltaproteobacteria bacterium]|nr:sugar nucleotide-binding protein [Deltaproteobacteria bacterium]
MQGTGPLLITGGSGYLGRHLGLCAARYAEAHPELGCEIVATCREHPERVTVPRMRSLDVSDAEAVRALVHELAPVALVHTAAANPGRDESLMEVVNVEGSRHVAEAARDVGARLVHLSSDVVHDGKKGKPYVEEDPPTAASGYGGSKARAEGAVAAAHPGAAIVRVSLLYDAAEMDRGTGGFAERLGAGEPVRLFSDVERQPISLDSTADALLALAFEFTDYSGVLNAGGRQVMSREAFGRRMLEWWQVPGRERVEAVKAADLPGPPPLDLRLDCTRAEALLGMTFPGVDEVLETARRG